MSFESSAVDLFYTSLNRYANRGIPPHEIKNTLMKDISDNIEYWWQYYEDVQLNPHWTDAQRDLVLDVYTIWMTLDDVAYNLVENTCYTMLYNW